MMAPSLAARSTAICVENEVGSTRPGRACQAVSRRVLALVPDGHAIVVLACRHERSRRRACSCRFRRHRPVRVVGTLRATIHNPRRRVASLATPLSSKLWIVN